MPTNTGAWLTDKATPVEIKSAPYTSPKENQIVIKNNAVAVNPVDWHFQDIGTELFAWITHPFIIGEDVAGEVVEVGSAVTRFKVGDRVTALASSLADSDSSQGGFQHYTIANDNLASPIPSALSYEQASVLPLGAATAAVGLFQDDHLALQYPTIPFRELTGKYVFITGGATSVGCNAIQLAVAAGYTVITTSSPKNFDLVKNLGAGHVVDYNDPKHVEQVIEILKGKTTVGALSISRGTFEDCVEVVSRSEGRKFISAALSEGPAPEGIESKFIFGGTLKDNGVGNALFADFLPRALEEGKYTVAPEAKVIGKGLESLQEALEVQKKGVSAAKVVVPL